MSEWLLAPALALLLFGLWYLKFVSATRNAWPNRLIRWFIDKAGYKFLYKDGKRFWTHRYDDIDAMMRRPIHENMSVAPPWAERVFLKKASLRPAPTPQEGDGK
jgi:hypothetical protein